MEFGECKAFTSRYYYDMDVQKCIMFIYGGCGGNGNNFGTKLECSSNCKFQVPVCIVVGYITVGSFSLRTCLNVCYHFVL